MVPKQLSIPAVQDIFLLFANRSWADAKLHDRICAKADARPAVAFNHVQAITLSLNIVAFAPHHLTLRLTILVIESGSLPTNPAQSRDDSQSHGLIIQAERRSNADPPIGRVHTKMQVLDVLTDNL